MHSKMKPNLVDQTCELLEWLCNYRKLHNTTTREQFWQQHRDGKMQMTKRLVWSPTQSEQHRCQWWPSSWWQPHHLEDSTLCWFYRQHYMILQIHQHHEAAWSCSNESEVNPLMATVAQCGHMGTANTHNIQQSECPDVKISNDGLTQSGTGCFIAVLCTHMATVAVKGLGNSQNNVQSCLKSSDYSVLHVGWCPETRALRRRQYFGGGARVILTGGGGAPIDFFRRRRRQ